jgi:hypothetical protein
MPHAINGKTMPEGVGVDVLAYQPCILVYEHPDPLLCYGE